MLRHSAFALLLAACGPATSASSTDAAPADTTPPPADPPAATPPPAPAHPAYRPTYPLASSQGGRVLHAVQVVTVTFDGDTFEPDLRAFDDGITQTPYWKATTSEYCDAKGCIGPGASGGYATLAAPPATLSDDDLRALLRAKVADGTLPAPTADTVYTVYPPASTTVSMPASDGGGASCVAYHGFHEHLAIGTQDAAYIVVARCPDAPTFDAMTMIGSHELVEAATDPDLDGWHLDDDAWSTWHGWELADVCLGESTVTEGKWTVERTYSSAAAKNGTHPCVPATPDDDFGVAPRAAEIVQVEVGGTTTVPLVGWSVADAEDFAVSVALTGGGGALTAALDRSKANDGATLSLRVGFTKTPADGGGTVLVRSKRGTRIGAWPVLVLTK
ncbi:MAG TPA: hypothetical protein VIF62_24870 [Labilithrix sp.]|jgi:hypothetical protein